MWDAAAAQFLRFARENPTDLRAPDALLGASECLVQAGDYEKAITVLETITSTYPDHPSRCEVQVQLGRIYYRLEQYDQADRAFTEVIVAMPDCKLLPDALLGKGETLISMQNYQAALEILTSLVDNHIESEAAPRASYNRAFCLLRLGREEEAVQEYEKIVVRFPRDPIAGFAALEAARMHAKNNENERALEYYTRAKQFDSKVFVVPASEEGADLLQSMGDHARALAWLEELLARPDLEDPRTVHIKAVRAAFNGKDYGSVTRLAAAYANNFPKTYSPQISYMVARSAVATGDYPRALDEAAKLEEFAAGTEWGRSGARIRGEALLGMGRADDAVSELERFVSIAADSTARCEVLRTIADVSFTTTRDTTRAVTALDELLAVQRRQYPGEMLEVAATYERVGRNREATAIYRDVEVRFPLSDEAEEAENRRAYLSEFTVTDYAAATRVLDRIMVEMATDPAAAGGLLRVARARVEVTKNFDGALEICRRLEGSLKNTASYPQLLYLEGQCHAKLARRAAHAGNQKRADEEMGRAQKPWKELEDEHAGSEWAARAAFDRVVLRAAVDGSLDPREATAVLAKYPDNAGGGDLSERLGDYYFDQGGAENMARAANYYARALNVDNTSSSLWLKSAMARAAMGKQDEALKTFERLAGDNDRAALRAAYEAGTTLRELKRYREAIPYFERVASRDERGRFGSSALLQAADCYYLQRNYDEALSRYQAAEKSAPTPARRWEVKHRIALCLRQMGQPQQALDALLDCVNSDEGGAQRGRVYMDAADVAGELGRTGVRREMLERFVNEVATGDEVKNASRQLVRAYLADGDADAARALAERLVSQAGGAGDDDVGPRALLAMALYRQGRTAEAKKQTDRVAEKAGADADIVREIGIEAARYHYDQKQFKQAAESIRPYAESCKGEGVCEEARYLHAMSLLADNQIQNGSAVAQSFFRDYPLSPHSPMLHLRMGNVLATANRMSESLLHYQEAAETAQDSTIAFMALKNLGVSYQKLTRWGDAERVWASVLERYPESSFSAEAALNVARCKMEQGKYQGAIDAYQEAMPMLDSESKARAFYWMGQSYEQLGNFQAAVVEYLKVPYLARAGGMWIVTAQLKAAECYRRIDRPDAAREIYTKVLNNHGANSNWGKLAQQGIDAIDGTAQTNNNAGGVD
jgi:tetratricopeptide (TPR) repeat protein